MTDKERKYLSDILNSVALIKEFTFDLNSIDQYRNDLKTKSAVERHLGIIGEAVNRFLKESPANDLKNANKIISVRNRLIHSYANIDDRIIWTIIQRHLNPLEKEIEEKMSKNTGD